jgi:hypothetical protein
MDSFMYYYHLSLYIILYLQRKYYFEGKFYTFKGTYILHYLKLLSLGFFNYIFVFSIVCRP